MTLQNQEQRDGAGLPDQETPATSKDYTDTDDERGVYPDIRTPGTYRLRLSRRRVRDHRPRHNVN